MLVETIYADNGASSSIFWNTMNLWEFLLLAISILILFASVTTVLFILRGWVLVILSWGKDDKIKPAINTIRYAFFWLIVMVATIFLFPIFWKLLWLDVQKYAEPKAIFWKIEELWRKVFWVSKSSTSIDNLDNFQEDDFINSL